MIDKNFVPSIPVKFSFSQYSKYKNCSWKYYLEKILKISLDEKSIHLIFGTAFHEACRKIVTGKLSIAEAIVDFQTEFEKLSREQSIEFDLEFVKQGVKILKEIPWDEIFDRYQVVSAEKNIEIEISKNIYFVGIIDLILFSKIDKKIIIVDWKTSTSGWNSYKLSDEIFISQLMFYKMFLAEKFEIPLDDIVSEYWVVSRMGNKGMEKFEVHLSSEDAKFKLGDLKYSIQQIHKNKIFEKIKFKYPSRCKYCPFSDKPEYCDNNKNQIINAELLNPTTRGVH